MSKSKAAHLPVLSCYQTGELLQQRQEGASSAVISLDLGLTKSEVVLSEAGLGIPAGLLVSWDEVVEIDEAENNVFALETDVVRKIVTFDQDTNCVYSLMPTERAPTMLISGIPMHRIKDTDPWRDTQAKIRAMGSIKGQVLDTATGLGYTAIHAARYAEKVTTIEVAAASIEIARQNPWSRDLFWNERIMQRMGDSYDIVSQFPDACFDRIIHDPPMFSLAGHLYSGEIYRHFWRILRARGRLFHYIGNPASPSGKGVTRSVTRRLQETGFNRIVPKPQAFGVLAFK